ncbi:MAG TPA: hypothetical protein VLA56_11050, partial [Pseudomonadales bacterium]|nr:hypothetical protein [Pseudomonadales bacterium]
NEFADAVTTALMAVFPDDPPLFMARTPHGYGDLDLVASELSAAGFATPAVFETLTFRSRAADPSIPAIAYCQGTPLRNEIEARDATLLGHATDVATAAIAERFGTGAVEGKIQGHVVTVEA